LDEVTTPILARPHLSAILRLIRQTIREAQGAGWPEVELTLTPGVYRKAASEFGLALGHEHAMPTQSERVHHSAGAMVRHVIHESVKALGWRWSVNEHARQAHNAWPVTKGILTPLPAVARITYDRDFDQGALLRDVLAGVGEEGASASQRRGLEMHRPIGISPALRALQAEARLLLEQYERGAAAQEEASTRYIEACLVADENALFKAPPAIMSTYSVIMPMLS